MPAVVCLNCGAKFKSKKDMTGKTVRCPRCDESFVVEGTDVLGAVAAPRSAPPPARAPRPAKQPPRSSTSPKSSSHKRDVRGKRRRKREGGGIPAPLVKLGALAIVAGLIWFGLSEMGYVGSPTPGIPGVSTSAGGDAAVALDGSSSEPGLLASMFGDTASSLTDELVECANDLRRVLATAQDEQSSQAAIQKLIPIAERLRDIQKRATRAPLVSKEEIDEIKIRSNAAVDRNGLQAQIERIATGDLAQSNLRYELEGIGMLMKSVGSTINVGLQKLPEPEKRYAEFGDLELERAQLHRRALQTVLAVNGQEDLRAAVDELDSVASKLTQLAERKQSMEAHSMLAQTAGLQYQEFLMEYGSQMHRHADALEEEGIDASPLTSAIVGVSTEDSKISFAKPKRRSGDATGAETPMTGSPPDRPSFGGTRPGLDGGRPPFGRGGRPPFGRGGSGGPSSIPTGPAAADEIIVSVKADLFAKRPAGGEEGKSLSQAKLKLSGDLQTRLRALTGSQRSSSRITGGASEIRQTYTGDPQALADKIDFGTVDSVNTESRRIEVTLTK